MAAKSLTRSRLALLALLAAPAAQAHPGWGIVEDRRGNIFYTDLAQVWEQKPDGTKVVAVPHVHTHELFIDAADNLYGEHLWYEGDATGKWGYRVWRRSPDGRIADIVQPTEGFRTSYSFIRDASGGMYWQKDGLVHRTIAGGDAIIARHRFHDIRSMAVSPAGDLFLIDDGSLFRFAKGRIDRLASNLAESSLTMPFVQPHHRVMGLWLDRQGRVYAAIFGARKVKRISPDGGVETVSTSGVPWSPSGGMVAHDGSLWLLEYSMTDQARVRKVGPASEQGRGRMVLLLGVLLAAVASGFIVVRHLRPKREPTR